MPKHEEIDWLKDVLAQISAICHAKAAAEPAIKAEQAAARLLALLECDHIIDRERTDLLAVAGLIHQLRQILAED